VVREFPARVLGDAAMSVPPSAYPGLAGGLEAFPVFDDELLARLGKE
jgi:hypothetical protein